MQSINPRILERDNGVYFFLKTLQQFIEQQCYILLLVHSLMKIFGSLESRELEQARVDSIRREIDV